jgi:hypothetical protein
MAPFGFRVHRSHGKTLKAALKRELTIEKSAYVLTISTDGLKVVLKANATV